jgi:toxin ParE1/3/4
LNTGYIFTPEAAQDLLEIWQYVTNEDGPGAADRVIDRIYAECQKLSEMPGIGHQRLELLDQQYKFWSVWSYLIAYKWQQSPLKVVSVVHGARDLGEFFQGRV